MTPTPVDVDNNGFKDVVIVDNNNIPDFFGFVSIYKNKGDGTLDDKPSMMFVDFMSLPEMRTLFKNGDEIALLPPFAGG